jgi:endo-1,4-beta-xylanase
MAIAAERGQRVRGHTLVWGALQLPDYVTNAPSTEVLRDYVTEHINGLVGRYAGRIAQWDVVNEPLPSITDPATPDGLDDNVFRRLLGPGYIAEALQLARAADPTAKLFVNENGIEVPGARQDRFYALVQDLLAAGAPLDGIGFQAHIGLIPPAQYPDRATLETSLRRFADLGLDVELTELDVTLLFRSGELPVRFAGQGADYRAITAACMAVARCSGLTTWGLSDRHTWLRSFFGFTDWPLPFDDDWARKPAYFGMRAAMVRHLFGARGGISGVSAVSSSATGSIAAARAAARLPFAGRLRPSARAGYGHS